jgi:hypothetical protein
MPFPKSFVWPNTALFTMAVFMSGLTKAAVNLLATQPERCDSECYIAAIASIAFVYIFLCSIITDLTAFRSRFGREIVFRPASREANLSDVADPCMWIRGQSRICCLGLRLMLRRAKQAVVDVADAVEGMMHDARDMIAESQSLDQIDRRDGCQYLQSNSTSPTHVAESAGRRYRMPAPVTADAPIGTQSRAAPVPNHPSHPSITRAKSRGSSRFVIARKVAQARVAAKGYANRSAGAFAIPQVGMSEPLRTERLLAAPFALYRRVPGDAFQARLGFLFFRVNGATAVGVAYRIIVLVVNVILAAVTGLTPLLSASPILAMAQAALVMTVQLSMAWLCYYYRPDADKIFSIFAGTQFLVEGLATACTLWSAVFLVLDLNTDDGTRPLIAFALSIIGIFVPMTQLVEQRLFQPVVKGVRAKGCNPLTLLGLGWIFLMSVPRMVKKLAKALAGTANDDNDDGGGGGEQGDGGADADGVADGVDTSPGDEAVGAEGPSVNPDVMEALGKASAKYAISMAGGAEMKRIEPTSQVDPKKRGIVRDNGDDADDGDGGGDD